MPDELGEQTLSLPPRPKHEVSYRYICISVLFSSYVFPLTEEHLTSEGKCGLLFPPAFLLYIDLLKR